LIYPRFFEFNLKRWPARSCKKDASPKYLANLWEVAKLRMLLREFGLENIPKMIFPPLDLLPIFTSYKWWLFYHTVPIFS
jgi:hypothetical protein